MQPLPTQDLRSNLASWRVPMHLLPAVGCVLADALPPESFDPQFLGQRLKTTYFDTPRLELRKNRLVHDKYITLRVRCYETADGTETYALSAKTEQEKFRMEIAPALAHALLQAGNDPLPLFLELLPANLGARLLEVSHQQPLLPAVTVCATRYAVEDEQDRLTLDCAIATDAGRMLPYGVLEFKSTDRSTLPPDRLTRLGLRPLKLSKFLWAMEV
jgi:hypothetical protein